MILHKLVARHLRCGDDAWFYALQAEDAIRWIQNRGVLLGAKIRALDLGCGHGVFGNALLKRGCQVVFSDEECTLSEEITHPAFRRLDIDREDIGSLGEHDLVVCSNVLEHLVRPRDFIQSAHKLLSPEGRLYLSWTNWLSPWGGHEFSPFHYLGARRGHLWYDRVVKRKRKHTPFVNLFPTHIGTTLEMISENKRLQIIAVAPRYYTELELLMRIPLLREFLAWNCALLIGRAQEPSRAVPGESLKP